MATNDEGFAIKPGYECQTCGTVFDVEYYVCPECGGFSVERPWRSD